MNKPFIDLHNHSTFSTLDGATKIKDYVNFAKENNLEAISINDHGNMDGVINFYIACKEAGIKSIIGSEMYISEDVIDKENDITKDNFHINIIAKNDIGFKNLIKLTTWANMNNFYKKPRITFEKLKEYSEGLIVTTACVGSQFAHLILNNRAKESAQLMLEYRKVFGDDFYIEYGYHGFENEAKYITVLQKIVELTGIKTIVANDSHYLRKEEQVAHKILMCKGENSTVHNMEKYYYEHNYYKNREEIEEIFSVFPNIDINNCIENIYEIINKCDVNIEFGKYVYSEFDVPENHTQDSYLLELVKKNIKKRYPLLTQEIINRVKYEMNIITKMKFSGYFLIVQDYTNWAKDNGIRVGPARGSGAGSIICYILGITEIEPLKYNLIFERFLNPARISFPDIDLDFETAKRHLVVEYLQKKYGPTGALNISTKGYLKGKSAIKCAQSRLGYDFQKYNAILRDIKDPKIDTVDKILEYKPEILAMMKEDEEIEQVINIAKQIEGNIQSTGLHAAGVILCHKDISDYCPIIRTNNEYATAWSDKIVEKIGLIKYDILGLSNLSVIDECLKRIENNNE